MKQAVAPCFETCSGRQVDYWRYINQYLDMKTETTLDAQTEKINTVKKL